MDGRKIRVTSYSGYRNEETPHVLMIDGRTITVAEVLARSISEEREGRRRQRSFTVRGDDGAIYRVRHDEARGEWMLDK